MTDAVVAILVAFVVGVLLGTQWGIFEGRRQANHEHLRWMMGDKKK